VTNHGNSSSTIYVSFACMVLSLCFSVSSAARLQVRSLATTVLHIEDVSDWAFNTFLLCVGYTTNYICTAALFEYTNPVEKTPKRLANIKSQIKYGALALFVITAYATLWLWLVDSHLLVCGKSCGVHAVDGYVLLLVASAVAHHLARESVVAHPSSPPPVRGAICVCAGCRPPIRSALARTIASFSHICDSSIAPGLGICIRVFDVSLCHCGARRPCIGPQ